MVQFREIVGIAFHRGGQETMQQPDNMNTNMNNMVVNVGQIPIAARNQFPWLARAIYFMPLGLTLSLIWILLAWIIAVTIIGLPLAQTMFLRTNQVMTLQRIR